MESFNKKQSNNLGTNSMDADSEIYTNHNDQERPFSPPDPNNRTAYLPEVALAEESSGSAVSRKMTDGFREIEISTQSAAKRKESPFQPPTIRVINETLDDKDDGKSDPIVFSRSEAYENETFEEDEDDIPNDDSYESPSNEEHDRKESEERNDGVERADSVGGGVDSSSKYGVTMNIKSGVKRTPWSKVITKNGIRFPLKQNEVAPLVRSATEETVVPSASSSMDSVLKKEHELEEPLDKQPMKKEISSRTLASQNGLKSGISSVSLAIYANIQKEGVLKRGNCILCTTATITLIVTFVLTICILIAPKTFAKKAEHVSEELIRHRENYPNDKLTQSLHKSNASLHILSKVNLTFSIDSTNITEVIPKR